MPAMFSAIPMASPPTIAPGSDPKPPTTPAANHGGHGGVHAEHGNHGNPQRAADCEADGHRDRHISGHVDPHQRRRRLVGGHTAHSLAGFCLSHKQFQKSHNDNGNHNNVDVRLSHRQVSNASDAGHKTFHRHGLRAIVQPDRLIDNISHHHRGHNGAKPAHLPQWYKDGKGDQNAKNRHDRHGSDESRNHPRPQIEHHGDRKDIGPQHNYFLMAKI